MANRKPKPGWKKGQSGNPKGREPIIRDIKIYAQQKCPEAFQTLLEIMQDQKAPHAARVRCAEIFIDRGYGKAPQILDVKQRNLVSVLVEIAQKKRDMDDRILEGESDLICDGSDRGDS